MLKRVCASLPIAIRTNYSTIRPAVRDGPGLDHFIEQSQITRRRAAKVFPLPTESDSYLNPEDFNGAGRKVKFLTYGCQMNVNDMEVVRSILFKNGYVETDNEKQADVVLLMTCSIRESAEDKIWRKLQLLRANAKNATVGVLGCMAERIREGILNKSKFVDVVVGPDAYRDLPRLLAATRFGQNAMNVQLSLEETYADIQPVRTEIASKSAFVSIMRGCDNMCTYCVVPFTRGRERSRPLESILDEVRRLSDEGFKQIILLGQNVNSYRDLSQVSVSMSTSEPSTVAGFKTVYKPKTGGLTFATLLDKVSDINPEMRIRFTSPHPKDFPLPVLQLIRDRPNICNQLHLPAQSGDNAVLDAMGRGYTRETYLDLIAQVKETIPGVGLTSDFIAGFCGETEEAHQLTLNLIREVGYYFCFVFPYSLREKTRAHRRLNDDVPDEVKQRRTVELANVFREKALKVHQNLIGTTQMILLEGKSRRSEAHVSGRIDAGTKVVIEDIPLPGKTDDSIVNAQVGDYVVVNITSATSQSLIATPLYRSSIVAGI